MLACERLRALNQCLQTVIDDNDWANNVELEMSTPIVAAGRAPITSESHRMPSLTLTGSLHTSLGHAIQATVTITVERLSGSCHLQTLLEGEGLRAATAKLNSTVVPSAEQATALLVLLRASLVRLLVEHANRFAPTLAQLPLKQTLDLFPGATPIVAILYHVDHPRFALAVGLDQGWRLHYALLLLSKLVQASATLAPLALDVDKDAHPLERLLQLPASAVAPLRLTPSVAALADCHAVARLRGYDGLEHTYHQFTELLPTASLIDDVSLLGF